MRRLVIAVAGLVVLLAGPAAVFALEPPAATVREKAKAEAIDRWYILEMGGGKAGWMHTQQKTAGGKITTLSKTKLSLKRGALEVGITMVGEFVETEDGKPISMRSQQTMGQSPVDQTWTFGKESVEQTTRQGGDSTTKTVDLPKGDWLTPAAAEREALRRFKAGEKSISIRTISPETGMQVITQTRTGFEPETIEVNGKRVEALRTSVETDAMAGVASTEWIDAEGEMIKNDTNLGGISVTMTRATRAAALDSEGGAAPEVMVATFVKPDKPIRNPRRLVSGTYLLSVPGDDMPPIPSAASQRAEEAKGGGVRIRVSHADPVLATAEEEKDPVYLASTAAANVTDERLRAFVTRALLDAPGGKADRAELLRQAVNSHIDEKNLGTAMATASEVVRTKEGDCSEHGVLLAAALRVDGIPSRVATGLIYADQFAGERDIFGYHMWTQALLDTPGGKAWVDLDATMPAEGIFDATHICLGTSDLGDGMLNQSLLGVARVLGRLEIKVEKLNYGSGEDGGGGK